MGAFHDAAWHGKIEDLKRFIRQKNVNERDFWNLTPLHHAAEGGKVEAIKILVAAGADKNAKADNGHTPMYKAIARGRANSVIALCEAGADPNVSSFGYNSFPIIWAADKNEINAVRALIKAGANVNAQNVNGFTALMGAVDVNSTILINELINAGAHLNIKAHADNNLYYSGRTALIRAADDGKTEAAKALIKAGADLNIRKGNGYTALISAAEKGHVNIVGALISANAQLDIQTKDYATALTRSIANGHTGIAKALIEAGADITKGMPLLIAGKHGRMEIAKMLLAAGASPSFKASGTGITAISEARKNNHVALVNLFESVEKDPSKRPTPKEVGLDMTKRYAMANRISVAQQRLNDELLEAAEKGTLEEVKALLSKKADANVMSPDGDTPLLLSVKRGHATITQELIRAGANVQQMDKDNNPLLTVAIALHNSKIAGLLLKAGSNTETPNRYGKSPLILAAESGDFAIAEALIEMGANIDATEFSRGLTPLNATIFAGETEMARFLITRGADIDARDIDDDTPLTNAIILDNSDVARLLIEIGADVNVQDKKGRTPLIRAVMSNNLGIIPVLINAKADVNTVTNEGGTALMYAAKAGYSDIAELLINRGANTNIQDESHGATALMWAANHAHIDTVKVLIDAGADLNIYDRNYGSTALIDASNKGNADIVDMLVTAGADLNHQDTEHKMTALMLAINKGHTDIAKMLINAKADVGLQDKNDNTALILAASEGNTDIANALIEADANLNSQDKNGITPLIGATFANNLDIVKSLIEAGADLNIQNQVGTALTWAALEGHTDIIKALIDAGAELDTQMTYGVTALTEAIRHAHTTVAKELIIAGANVDLSAETGATPLILAAQNGYEDVVNALIDADASLDDQQRDGYTALRLAASRGHTKIVKSLIEAGADLNIPCRDGKTPLHIASLNAHHTVVDLLLAAGAELTAIDSESKTPTELPHVGFFKIADYLKSIEKDPSKRPTPESVGLDMTRRKAMHDRQVRANALATITPGKLQLTPDEIAAIAQSGNDFSFMMNDFLPIADRVAMGSAITRAQREDVEGVIRSYLMSSSEFRKQIDEAYEVYLGHYDELQDANAKNKNLEGKIAAHEEQEQLGRLQAKEAHRDALLTAGVSTLAAFLTGDVSVPMAAREWTRWGIALNKTRDGYVSPRQKFIKELEKQGIDTTPIQGKINGLIQIMENYKSSAQMMELEADTVRRDELSLAIFRELLLEDGRVTLKFLEKSLRKFQVENPDDFLHTLLRKPVSVPANPEEPEKAALQDTLRERVPYALRNLLFGMADTNDLFAIERFANSLKGDKLTANEQALVHFVEQHFKPNYSDYAAKATRIDLAVQEGVDPMPQSENSRAIVTFKENSPAQKMKDNNYSVQGSVDIDKLFSFYLTRHGSLDMLVPARVNGGLPGDDAVDKKVEALSERELKSFILRLEQGKNLSRSDIPNIDSLFLRICASDYFQDTGIGGAGGLLANFKQHPEVPVAFPMISDVIHRFVENMSFSKLAEYRATMDDHMLVDNLIAQTFIDFFKTVGLVHSMDPDIREEFADLKNGFELNSYRQLFKHCCDTVTEDAVQRYDLFVDLFEHNLNRTLEVMKRTQADELVRQLDDLKVMGKAAFGDNRVVRVIPGSAESLRRFVNGPSQSLQNWQPDIMRGVGR